MKMIKTLMTLLILVPALVFGQLKKDTEKVNISNTLLTSSPNNSFLGFLDPAKLNMRHSFSMSYTTMGAGGIMLNTYLNTINYKINDQFSLMTNLGIMASPYNNLPNQPYLSDTHFFGGAQLTYRPSDDTSISLRIESLPYMYYRPSYFYTNPFYYRNSIFENR